jgi:hypothetical protein
MAIDEATPEQMDAALASLAALLLDTERKLPDAARVRMTHMTNMTLGIAMAKAPREYALFMFRVAMDMARALRGDVVPDVDCAGVLALSADSWRKAPQHIRAGVERVREAFNNARRPS